FVTASATSSSADTIPSATGSGLKLDTNGTRSAVSEIGVYESIAIVATWIATNVPVRIPAKRWTSSRAKRGHFGSRRLPDSVRPSATTAERSKYATIPAARAAYQSTGLEVRCTPA